MDTYTIVKKPEKLDWSRVPALQIDKWHHTEPMPVSAQAQVCYDDTALYVRLSAVEPNIKATYSGLLDEVSEDSCLEFFFCPKASDQRYFNIEVNPNGAMYLGFGPSIEGLMRLIPEEMKIVPQITMTGDGWIVEYTIPYVFIRVFFPDFSPVSGDPMRANCYKCADAGENNPPHSLCWQPVVKRRCAFHNPDCFGTMIFE